MATQAATIHTKVEKRVRDKAMKAARALGVPLSLVIVQRLREFADDPRLVIEKSLKPTPYLEKILREADDDLRKGKAEKFNGPFTGAEFIAHLRKRARS